MHSRVQSGTEITGRAVFLMLTAFFAVVIGVNAVLLRAASLSFGGVETESSYKAGLAFKNETASARAQEARGWQVGATVSRPGGSTTAIEIAAIDAAGRPISGLDLALTLAHPADRRLDRIVATDEVAAGRFRGEVEIQAGQWELVMSLSRDGESLFRSRNRVVIR